MTRPAAEPAPALRGGPSAAAGLVIVGLMFQEVGASIAVLLFPHVGALGMVASRLGFSALLLLLIARPSLRGRSARDWWTVAGFGAAIAVMNATFYLALERIPLGAAVTIEVLGPLVLSVVLSRRLLSWLWAVIAFAGVAILGGANIGTLDPLGVLFAFGAAACWAGYILTSAATGRRFARLDGLALAMAIGAVAAIPVGIVTAGPPAFFDLRWLALGLAVAVFSSTIPYAVELLALRRLPASAFGILMSLAPALAAAAGFVILRQQLGVADLVAMALVIVASIGAVRTARRPRPGADADPAPAAPLA